MRASSDEESAPLQLTRTHPVGDTGATRMMGTALIKCFCASTINNDLNERYSYVLIAGLPKISAVVVHSGLGARGVGFARDGRKPNKSQASGLEAGLLGFLKHALLTSGFYAPRMKLLLKSGHQRNCRGCPPKSSFSEFQPTCQIAS